MSIIRVKTSQGIKRVKIAGDQPTPEEVEKIRAYYEPGTQTVSSGVLGGAVQMQPPVAQYDTVLPMNEMGGTQTIPMTPTLPEAPPEPAPPPEMKPLVETPQEQAMARQRAAQQEAYNRGEASNRISPLATHPQKSEATFEQLQNTTFGIGKGAGAGLGHMVKTAFALVPETSIVDALGQISPYADRSDIADTSDSPLGTQDMADSMESKLREIPREEGFAGFAQSMTQFAVPYLAARSVGAPSPVASFVAGSTGFDTQTERLSNILRDGTIMGLKLEDPVTEYLAHKPGSETMLEGALKNGIEMGLLDAGISLTFMAGLKSYRTLANAGKKGQNPQKVLDNLKRDPNYDKQLELHDAVNFADQPGAKTSPLPKLKKTKFITHKGSKVAIDRAKEDSLHASQYSEEGAIRLQKAKDDLRKAGFIKLGVDDFADTPVAQGARQARDTFDKFVRPIKSKIIATHPQLGPRASTILDHFELEQNILATEAYGKLDPLLKMYSRMKGADKKLWNSAYKQDNPAALYDIARRYENGVSGVDPAGGSLRKIKIPGFQQELRNTFRAFEEMHQVGTQHGIKMGKRKDYLPLEMRDFKGFRKSIGRSDDPLLVELEQEMKTFAAKNIDEIPVQPGDPPIDPSTLDIDFNTGIVKHNGTRHTKLELSDYAKEKVALDYMRLSEAGGTGQKPGVSFSKERTVRMTPEVEGYYHDFPKVVSLYPRKWAYEIAHNRLQGKVPGMEHQGYKEVLTKMAKDLNIPEGKTRGDISRLIGERLRAGEKSLSLEGGSQSIKNNFFQGYRDFVYVSTLGNIFSTITQTSEFGLNAYRNGIINNLAGTKTATLDNLPKWMQRALKHTDEGVRMKDLGLADIGAEYQGGGQGFISGSVNKLLGGGQIKGVNIPGVINLAGFRKMDFLMKESNLNGALLKARNQLKTAKGEKAFRDKMSPYYQEQTDDLIKGIKSGKKDNDLTKLYLYQELAKTQPISLSEMPEAYLKSEGFGKSFYFLKSFGLKQLETARRDVIRQLASGDKKEAAKGVYNLLGLGLLFGGGTVGQNMLKDFILDRDNSKAADYIEEAAWNLGGLSRHQKFKFDRNKLPTAFRESIAMPAPVIEEIGQKDFFEKTQKNWPLFGKYLYWKHGYGKDIIRKDRDKRMRGREKRMKEQGIPLPPRPPKAPAPPKP